MTPSLRIPAREIHHEELGNLSTGAIADVAILRVARGDFGYNDMYGARPDWTTLLKGYLQSGDARWDAITPAKKP
jgi:dihydroorotase